MRATLVREPFHRPGWIYEEKRELNYVEGRNLVVSRASAAGRAEDLTVLAGNLVQANFDVIVTTATRETRAARQITSTIPIVMSFVGDPVGQELKSFGTDDERKSVCAYGVFSGTHTGQGGPCPPTGKSVKTDYVYVMDFDGEKIRHMTKIWHAGLAMKELGWV